MLVLTRKVGEQLLIGEEVVITVLEVRGDGIKIGIDAPRDVKVQRREVLLSVSETNLEAARAAGPEAETALKAIFSAGAPNAGAPATGHGAADSSPAGPVDEPDKTQAPATEPPA
ncbi:carbon storage regulator CsrA [Nesterenkonia lutea]|uniref:Translational regulator CsrA n=1 Tax=Nesterenkonia lutea TaxID=272919 RepID=A0ABR9JFB4_9MICC|nr:carbon storage regulator CsrA [Nesterenkonia lutea]MBE1524614.1 carbon storage regulator [Nesterenkonia lutea]